MKLLSTDTCSEYPAITSDVLFTKSGPHPDGLFSQIIWDSPNSMNFAVIHLNTELFHPEIWYLLRKVFRNKIKAIIRMLPYKIENGEIVILEEEQEGSHTGLTYLIENFLSLKIPESTYGQKLKKLIDQYPESYKISCMLVVPPVLRPLFSEHNLDPLNQAYVNLIKYSKKIIQYERNTEQYKKLINLMQIQIEKIHESILKKLGKKIGIIRQNLLGKRLDFTGRSVITVDPELKVDEVGIPVKMATKLFEPWIVRELTRRGFTIDQALNMISDVYDGRSKPGSETYEEVKNILQIVTKDRVVLIKRDPSLHRLSWQAFYVKLVDDLTIHINPLVTVPFNADFDGDSYDGKISVYVKHKDDNEFQKLILHIKDLKNLSYEDGKFFIKGEEQCG